MNDKFYGSVKAGSKDISITVLLRSSTNNQEVTGKTASVITAQYWRQGSIPVAFPVNDLVSLDIQHSDGGWKEVDPVNQKGVYRLDVPDEAWADGCDWVLISVTTSAAFVFYERYNLETDPDESTISGITSFAESLVNSYLTRGAADEYFATRLNSESWDEASDINKDKALITATRLIDRLNFVDSKSDEDQLLQFPRGGDISVPDDIKIATCEIAISLLSGIDIEKEIKNLNITLHQFDKVKTVYDRSFVQEYMRHGIPSSVAWEYLVPYLRDARNVQLSRIN